LNNLTAANIAAGIYFGFRPDGTRYLRQQGIIHTPVRDSINAGIAVGSVVGGGRVVGVARSWITSTQSTPNPRIPVASTAPKVPVATLTREMNNWLGSGARVITNRSGDKIFISRDGLRKARFDINNPSPHNSPHAHFEQFTGGAWRPINPNHPQIYPRGVPHR